MNGTRPEDDFPVELLAAYVDDELDEPTRARVKTWLADHPEALADLFDQQDLSPANVDLWNAVSPPAPAPETWDCSLANIENRLRRPPLASGARRRTLLYLAPAFALASMAAAILIVVVSFDRGRADRSRNGASSAHGIALLEPLTPPTPVDRVAGVEEEMVFHFATHEDVELIHLPEEAASLIVVGRHPIEDSPLVLASASDLDILSLGPDDQGTMPDVQITSGRDAPMLVAQPRRR